jgi:hypothetical protein
MIHTTNQRTRQQITEQVNTLMHQETREPGDHELRALVGISITLLLDIRELVGSVLDQVASAAPALTTIAKNLTVLSSRPPGR